MLKWTIRRILMASASLGLAWGVACGGNVRHSPASGVTGVSRDLVGLHFDPLGADYSAWVQGFKDEVYRYWVVPEAARVGQRKRFVGLEFVVEKSGAVTSIRVLRSSGAADLDRAAEEALRAGHFLALPQEYSPPNVAMQVSFGYAANKR